ncbi:dioxygenase [Shewanella sp. AS1]|uniref:DODA-type extradiol aromatic ring-opening family dioxygenase n=1 Tax=Shewanella sp. AS1 TaxID=2907626 RepID=UPI001F244078|nr:class III extradiol ring-cleavage dioxygenase [Shewanella sp. AS1]MCE9678676.1 dioxygenase [Shewanella sp. AS1]
MSAQQISLEMDQQFEAAKRAGLMPSLFVSHGSPMLALEDSDNAAFLTELGGKLLKPKGIVVFSAHTDSQAGVRITAGEQPKTVHDFYGFPDALYRIEYRAPGAPALAEKVANLLKAGGLDAVLDKQMGWDHGLWNPLCRLYPQADIPVVQVSLDTSKGAKYHYQLGKALSSLRAQGVLILGSGGISHNLREIFSRPGDPDRVEKMQAFVRWIADGVAKQDLSSLLDYEAKAPYARFNHPTVEHLMPFYVALGAGQAEADTDLDTESGSRPALRLHQSVEMQILALDSYAWFE